MSEAKHTAAPWAFEAEETSSGPMFSVYDARGKRLTEPYVDEHQARLIAAAPHLLGFARYVADMDPENNAPLFAFARAVLAKAGGRS